MLRDVGNLRTEYSTEADDIASEFYNPCLSNASSYNRITGFFSSTVFHLTYPALQAFFLENDGRMRVLCSPRMSGQDADSLLYGYSAREDASLVSELHAELTEMLASQHAETSHLLAVLVASGKLDVKLARVEHSTSPLQKAMFHDKVGLFGDLAGDVVGFRGSLNETYLGLSSAGNIESVDVWPSWEGGRDAERVGNAVARFEALWEGRAPGVTVVELPEEIREELERVAEDQDLEKLLRGLAERGRHSQHASGPDVGGVRLRQHQQLAVRAWESHEHRGLLAHATGSGKTITGLYCAQLALRAGLTPIVLVPSELLLEQWAEQLRQLLGARVLLAGGGHSRWTSGSLLRAAVEASTQETPYAVVAVLNSAISPGFRAQLRPVAHKLFVIADEAHRLGSPQLRTVTDWLEAPWRLGLSATPERANDPVGTGAVFDYFGGIVHRYSLKDALDDHVLAPYVYHPSWVALTDDEQERWDALTQEIRRLHAIARSPGAHSESQDQLLRKLIQRARIAKSASRKVAKAADIVQERYRPEEDQKWLVYCDSQVQLREVRQALHQRGIDSWEYHRQMQGDSEATLKLFDISGGIVVAIKCLDEGVDIPAATHALILASSRNPREFIQRRGRVLRRSPNKAVASVMDVLVLPETVQKDDPSWPLVVGELGRALEFAQWGLGGGASSRLEDKWVSMGLSLELLDEISEAGIEEDASSGT